MQRDTVATLARHPFFRRLSHSEKAALFAYVREQEYTPNTLLFREGAKGNSLYVIVRGEVMLQRELGHTPVPVLQLGAGEQFGELALLAPGTRLLTAKAISSTLVARLAHDAFERFASEHPNAALQVRLRILETFLRKVRHLEPLWEPLIRQGLEAIERGELRKAP